MTKSPLSRALRPYGRRAMSRTRPLSSLRSLRRALLAAPVLAAAASGAHATQIQATVDTLTYTCSQSDNLQLSVEFMPIWSWNCGIQEVICVQAGVDSRFDLDSSTLFLDCVQMTPHPSTIFYDNFEDVPPG